MSKFAKKLWQIVPWLVAVSLPFMTWITMTGGSVALEADELSSIGTALTSWGGSLLNVGIQLLPYIIALTVILIIYGIVRRFWRLRRG